jgi:hypothetical protein
MIMLGLLPASAELAHFGDRRPVQCKGGRDPWDDLLQYVQVAADSNASERTMMESSLSAALQGAALTQKSYATAATVVLGLIRAREGLPPSPSNVQLRCRDVQAIYGYSIDLNGVEYLDDYLLIMRSAMDRWCHRMEGVTNHLRGSCGKVRKQTDRLNAVLAMGF